jgi:endo-1,4-beta-D-glucanase Y
VRRLALALVLLAFAGCGQHGSSSFLDRYVDDDGRVVREDQGGDTVSEGQAYALLLAVADDDEQRFARVWEWTRAHLMRDDGLLSWRWADGHVVGSEPAADADLDTARALMLASQRFDEPSYRDAALALKKAIVKGETTWAADRTVLVAGTWARGMAVVNPSYWSPKAYQQLGFEKVAVSSRQLTERLLESGLPPDWARVEPFGIVPNRSPSGDAPVYSYDAVRLPIRFAESCDPADRALAAKLWPKLRDDPGATRRALDGAPAAGDEHAVALTGAAAAAWAAGDRDAYEKLMDQATTWDDDHPTYYGSAWIELTRAMLERGSLGDC